jgi:hypothetical protein
MFISSLTALVTAQAVAGTTVDTREATLRRHTLAFPAIIVFEGGSLHRRVVVTDQSVNSRLLLGRGNLKIGRDVAYRELSSRPYLEVWLYWGSHWQAVARDSNAVKNLRESAANQHGRFYPASGTKGALLLLDATGMADRSCRSEADDVLDALKPYGIPIKVLGH